jgi:hypothetical protein
LNNSQAQVDLATNLGQPAPAEPDDEIPDWLATGANDKVEDLVGEQTNIADEVRKEMAEWVAAKAIEMDDDESLNWLSTPEVADAAEEIPLAIVDAALPASADAPGEPSEAEEDLPDWLRGDSVQYKNDSGLLDSGLLNTSAFGEDAATDAEEINLDFISNGLPDWLEEDLEWEEIDAGGSDKLPDWLLGDTLDIPDSAPLPQAPPAPSEADFLFELTDETAVSLSSPTETNQQPPAHGSEMLRAAAAMDYSFDDAVMEGADLPDWLSTGLEQEQPAEISATAGMDLEVVVSDEKDAQLNGPDQEPTDLPQPEGELDWLDELDTFPPAAPTMIDAMVDTGELPDWMQFDEAETPVPAELPPAADPAVTPEFPLEEDAPAPLEAEPDLDWLEALAAEPQADPADEMPTWQWPEAQADPSQLTAVEMDTLMAMEVAATETAVPEQSSPVPTADPTLYDDLDDAMAWLEELAAEPDAPIEELSTIAQEIELADTAPPRTATDWLAVIEEEEFTAIELEEMAFEAEEAETEEDEDTFEARLTADDLAEAALLDALFASAENELSEAEPAQTDFTDQETIILVEQTITTEESILTTEALPLTEADLVEETTQPPLAPVSDDLFAADFLIDDLAGDDFLIDDLLADNFLTDSPLANELTTANLLAESQPADDAIDDTIDDYGLPPEDPEAAMAWLEQLAARQGTPLEELPSIPTPPEEDLLAAADMLAGEQSIGEQPESSSTSETDLAETADDVIAADLFDADLFGDEDWANFSFSDVPEDPEDAMAWLETLAARQGTPLDELPAERDETSDSDFDDKASVLTIVDYQLETAVTPATASDDSDDSDDDDDDSDDDDLFLVDFNREAELLTVLADEPDEPDETEPPAEASATGREWEELALAMDDLVAADAASANDDALASVPDELDAAMVWLEQLAARQGAPLEELPSITPVDFLTEDDRLSEDDLLVEEYTPLEDEPITAVADLPDKSHAPTSDAILDELEDAMEWLDSLVETEPADIFATEPDLDLEVAVGAAVAANWEPADLTEAEFVAPTLPDHLAAELDWLEATIGLTGDETAVPATDLDETSVSNEELQVALEQLVVLAQTPLRPRDAAPQETSDHVIATPDDLEPESFTPAATEPAIFEPEITTPDLVQAEADWSTIPDDPEEAMAWLERLAARQGAALDELPSLKDADEMTLARLTAVPPSPDTLPEPEPEIASPPAMFEPDTAVAELDMPENIDDALAWLERLAARQGASLDELPSVSGEVDDIATPAWIAAGSVAAPVEAVEVDMRDKEAIGGDFATEPEEPALAATIPNEMAELDSIEDAMAWLEKLAARQGASLDELPSVNEALAETDDLELPDWIAAQMAGSASEQEHELAEMELDDAALFAADEESAEWVETFISGKTGPIAGDDAKPTGPLDDIQFGLVEIDDSLPDWLMAEEDAAETRVSRHTDWLDALPEPDLEGWLAAEEEATLSSPTVAEPETTAKGHGGPGRGWALYPARHRATQKSGSRRSARNRRGSVLARFRVGVIFCSPERRATACGA